MRAILYTLDRDKGDRSFDNLNAYAKKKGIEVIGSYLERRPRIILGNLWDRSEFICCLSQCQRDHPDILLVSTLADLGESTANIGRAIDILSENRIPLYILDLGIRTLRPDGTTDRMGTLIRRILREAFRIDNEFFNKRLNRGRERYKESGGRLGRPNGTSMTPDQIIAKYPGVASRLAGNQDGGRKESLAEIARIEGVSISTVKKVKRATALQLAHQLPAETELWPD